MLPKTIFAPIKYKPQIGSNQPLLVRINSMVYGKRDKRQNICSFEKNEESEYK